MNIYSNLHLSYKALENPGKALEYHELFVAIKDSLFNINRQKMIAEYQTKLNLANKEYFIKQLEDSTRQQQIINQYISRQNRLKQISIYGLVVVVMIILLLVYLIFKRYKTTRLLNAELEIALKEREVLIREVHHRVKNNLQIISSLLNLQSEQATDKKESDVLRISQSRVEAMSMIHENLYKSDKISNIDFSNYVKGLSSYMRTSFDLESRNITLSTNIPQLTIDIDKLVPCGLIITELVTNSIKHAFDDKSENKIDIICNITGDIVMLIIHDNGKGIDPGFDFRKSKSLGLRLVYGLARQIKSELKYENDNGLKVWFEFKMI
jgi:two-component sensor histidine kinase